MSHEAEATAALQSLTELFEQRFGLLPELVSPLPASGSDRRYYRLTANGATTAIGAVSSNIPENRSYVYFTGLLQRNGIRVPELYGISGRGDAYLQQDLGNESLFDLLKRDGHTAEVQRYFAESLAQLARAQWLAGKESDFSQCFAAKRFDAQAILTDLHYFKFYFADLQKVSYNRAALAEEMNLLSESFGAVQPQTLMYRDFQSRNIMIHEGRTCFIDYQGAMEGPPQYDVASLLWQAKAALPAAWKSELYDGYIASVKELGIAVEEQSFRQDYVRFVLLRLLQVLGAYGFRGLLERKPHFLSSIAPALRNLEVFLADNPDVPACPELRGLLERLAAPEVQRRFAVFQKPEETKLKISVCSFSYKNGFPTDSSGHGGGYVFDCRGLLNPGRYEAYKKLSGQDAPVKSFLESETQMPSFLEHAKGMIALNVEDYLSRGFEHLSIAFGCTGGQHRSVYSADATGKWLEETYGVPVSVQHLNRERWVR